jgi:hypothetical protein
MRNPREKYLSFQSLPIWIEFASPQKTIKTHPAVPGSLLHLMTKRTFHNASNGIRGDQGLKSTSIVVKRRMRQMVREETRRRNSKGKEFGWQK